MSSYQPKGQIAKSVQLQSALKRMSQQMVLVCHYGMAVAS